MKIVFTGGGTGGHFYPIIAIVESLYKIVESENLLDFDLYYFSDDPYDKKLLYKHNIEFRKVSAGKLRKYFSPLNFFDSFKTAFGIIAAVWKLYVVYPDVVVSKGGYAAFPTLVAARFLRIPVFIHESDSIPGRVNLWGAQFAQKVAMSYPEAAKHFTEHKDKLAYTGNPIRHSVLHPIRDGAHEYLKLEENVPIILILGGSQGAQTLNDVVLEALPSLLNKYQIIHQVGKKNITKINGLAEIILGKHEHAARYRPFDFLNDIALRMSAGVADLVISRAGSTIFEIAHWGIPSIVVPLPRSISRDQVSNAYNYAREGAAIVIEHENLISHVLESEIDRLIKDTKTREKMKEAAASFSHADAADKIAEAIVEVSLRHEG